MQPELATLTPFERFAFRAMRFWNTGSGRGLAWLWQRFVVIPFVSLIVGRRIEVHGLERLKDLPRDAPILLVSNHRTFFDQFVLGYILIRRAGFPHRISFPVRANFFYENPLGLLICMALSGGSMFPPFFRSGEKMPFNKYALQLLIEKLRQKDELVGFHPEGTRNKTDDPYTLLPAQPGVGELALKARPVVVPAFVTGLSNGFLSELKANLRRERPIVAVYGEPIDLSQWPGETRLSHHKRCADTFNARIAGLGQEERALRISAPSPAAPKAG